MITRNPEEDSGIYIFGAESQQTAHNLSTLEQNSNSIATYGALPACYSSNPTPPDYTLKISSPEDYTLDNDFVGEAFSFDM